MACVAAVLLPSVGCSSDDGGADPGAAAREPAHRDARPAPAKPQRPPRLERATCPPGLSNCRSASGRILYVERVDPDGDGDAHFVLLSRQGVTSPGISVIDVRRSLRPSPLPGPGDRLSAAGPVERGSYGQRQIAAVELHVGRR